MMAIEKKLTSIKVFVAVFGGRYSKKTILPACLGTVEAQRLTAVKRGYSFLKIEGSIILFKLMLDFTKASETYDKTAAAVILSGSPPPMSLAIFLPLSTILA